MRFIKGDFYLIQPKLHANNSSNHEHNQINITRIYRTHGFKCARPLRIDPGIIKKGEKILEISTAKEMSWPAVITTRRTPQNINKFLSITTTKIFIRILIELKFYYKLKFFFCSVENISDETDSSSSIYSSWMLLILTGNFSTDIYFFHFQLNPIDTSVQIYAHYYKN